MENIPDAIEEKRPDINGKTESMDGSSDRDINEEKIDFLLAVPLEIAVVLGRTEKRIDQLLRIGQGSVVEFSNLTGEPVDILVNHTLIAKGEVVVEKEKYGVRVIEIISRMERIQSLR